MLERLVLSAWFLAARARGAVLKAAGGGSVKPSRRAAGKKRLDLFEITLAIGHPRSETVPRALPN